MSGNLVIAIGRQCGSSGKVIGQKLAERLGVKCYDKELLTLAAKNSGLSEELFQTHDERPTNSFLYSLVMDTYSVGLSGSGALDMPIDHKIFLAQFDTIKQLADQESCVIVGRCADYALAEYPNLISVFISAEEEDKIKSLKDLYQINDAKAKELMGKTDKKRSNYYNYYSSKKWGDVKSYDVCINRSSVGIENAASLLKAFAEAKMEWKKQN